MIKRRCYTTAVAPGRAARMAAAECFSINAAILVRAKVPGTTWFPAQALAALLPGMSAGEPRAVRMPL